MSKGNPQVPDASRPDILGLTIIGSLLALVMVLVALHILVPGVSL